MKSYNETTKFKTADAAVKHLNEAIKTGMMLGKEKATLYSVSLYETYDYSKPLPKNTKPRANTPKIFSLSLSWRAGKENRGDFLD